jgi:hypothetical protein
MLTHALRFVVETNGVLTGNVAVMALATIRGVPTHVWTLAIVAPPGVSKTAYAAGLFQAMVAASPVPAIRLEDRSGLWIEVVDALDGMTRVATVSEWPAALAHDARGEESTWIVPVMHDGFTWLPRCYRPPVLRAQAVAQHATQLVARLDEIMATRVARGMLGGIWPSPSSSSSSSASVVSNSRANPVWDDCRVDSDAATQEATVYCTATGAHGLSENVSSAPANKPRAEANAASSAPAVGSRSSQTAPEGTTFVAVATGDGDQFFSTTIWSFADAWARALMRLPHLNPGWSPPETIPGLQWEAVVRLQQCAHAVLYQSFAQGMTHVTALQAMLAAGIYVPEGIPHFLSLTFLGSPSEILG